MLPTKTTAQFTVQQIIQFIQQIEDILYDYDLCGTKETIDLVRDELPYNIKPVEVPEGFLPNPKNVYLIRREYLKGYNIYDEF